MNLFADLYLDEDVSGLVATLLGVRGFKVSTTRDQGMLGRLDEQQLAHASELRCCIITHNRLDYERLHQAFLSENKKHFGIIVGARRDAMSWHAGLLNCSTPCLRTKLKINSLTSDSNA